MAWCSMPMVECPGCGHKWQYDDYYRLESGDTFDCPGCEKEIEIAQMDVVTEVDLKVKGEA